jgi:hypothetical protein
VLILVYNERADFARLFLLPVENMKTKRPSLFLLGLLLVSCSSPLNLWGAAPLQIPAAASTPVSLPTATAIPTSTQTATPFPSATVTLNPTPTNIAPAASATTETVYGIERVLIVSFDGLRPDAISAAPMTNVLGLMETGAYTLTARTISYAATLPAHASMLSGMCLAKTGVDWNRLLLYRGYSKGTDLFDLTHAAGMRSVMIVGKDKLRQVAEPETTDVFLDRQIEIRIAQAGIGLLPFGFDLMFFHFPSADDVGHKYGWMSNAQLKTLREADAALGEFLTALEQEGLRETTLIIVTADHGGHDRVHTGILIEDLQIPWIASGPGIVPTQLTTPVQTMDTAATAAYALGLPIPSEWDGVPVYEAFGLPIGERKEVVCP